MKRDISQVKFTVIAKFLLLRYQMSLDGYCQRDLVDE
jgi:hypothetical protein